jgi:hypothetical protein
MIRKAILLLACILYPAHILMDLTSNFQIANYIKFAVIICAFMISLLGEIKLVKVALFLTLLCDFFLLFTDHTLFGVSLFCVVQLVYSYLLSSKKSKATRYCYLILAALPFMYFYIFRGPLVYLFYASILFSNLVIIIKNRQFKLIFAFCLFALCDLNVAAYNLTHNLFSLNLIWVFYTPSQLLISLSCPKEWQPRKI